MGREPDLIPYGFHLRAMTEVEVGRLVVFLKEKAERYWAHHTDAQRAGRDHAYGFKLEAKTYENVERSLLWRLDGRDPITGAKRP